MTDFTQRVQAALELASRATKFNFYFDPAKNYGPWEPISILAERFEDAALLGSAHAHVALIRDLHAALLASEEARGKAEVDARRMQWGIKNARWIRHEHEAYVAIPVALDADLSAPALRVIAIDAAIQGESK